MELALLISRILVLMAPHIGELVQTIRDRNVDPETIDWESLLGPTIQQLRDEVDRQTAPITFQVSDTVRVNDRVREPSAGE